VQAQTHLPEFVVDLVQRLVAIQDNQLLWLWSDVDAKVEHATSLWQIGAQVEREPHGQILAEVVDGGIGRGFDVAHTVLLECPYELVVRRHLRGMGLEDELDFIVDAQLAIALALCVDVGVTLGAAVHL